MWGLIRTNIMSKTTKTKWRLSELPTPSELTELVTAGILTKEEAREILISLETDEERDKKSLQGEIKFLRELVEKLSNNRRADIIREIQVIEKPYYRQPWFQPYYSYVNAVGLGTTATMSASSTAGGNNLIVSGTGSSSGTNALYSSTSGTLQASAPSSFSAIKTF